VKPADPRRGDVVVADPWTALRELTPARIALGRAGHSLPTRAVLDFQLAHARARDAIGWELDLGLLARGLAEDGFATALAESAAPDRATYVQRPDLGRRLAPGSREALAALGAPCDVAFAVCDGLSPLAVERHARAFLAAARAALDRETLGPVVLVRGGRVAIGDEIGELLGARLIALLVGERPGLSSPDSLGVYVTYDPRPGRTDGERACISNVRPPDGLAYADAAARLRDVVRDAFARGATGVRRG
jgi:ethanolamine ammonia-lyase small subunit